MASHWPFGHLSPKLWAKEGLGVKLAIRLPTTKSRESTSSRLPNWKCDMALERSQRGLQLWSRPCCDQTLQSGVMSVQSLGTPTGTISGLQLGSPEKKSHLDVRLMERCREYYIGEGGGPPSPGHGESCVSKCPWLVPTPKGVPECELTCRNLTLAKCGGEAQHLEKARTWSPPGLLNV
jgi:hypothetical protein